MVKGSPDRPCLERLALITPRSYSVSFRRTFREPWDSDYMGQAAAIWRVLGCPSRLHRSHVVQHRRVRLFEYREDARHALFRPVEISLQHEEARFAAGVGDAADDRFGGAWFSRITIHVSVSYMMSPVLSIRILVRKCVRIGYVSLLTLNWAMRFWLSSLRTSSPTRDSDKPTVRAISA